VPFVVLTNSGNANNRTGVFAAPNDDEQQGDNINQQESSGPVRSWQERVNSHNESRRSSRD